MEPPEVLAIHAVPHPNPKVRRAGFALDDPYVEQVWAGVIGPSALLTLRRLPVLWREREPALVDLSELGQSLGLGPWLARSGRTWRTIERLVGFGMAHWLPGNELGARRWRRSTAASLHGCPGGPARSYYNDVRPHRALGRRTPRAAYEGRPKATPRAQPLHDAHYRVRHDTIDACGKLTIRYGSHLHHIGIGRRHAGTKVLILIKDLHVRITTTNGEPVRDLVLDPTRDYQPQPKT